MCEIVPRDEAIAFLEKPKRGRRMRQIWGGAGWQKGPVRVLKRHNRGAGGKADLINYGLRSPSGSLCAVMRIGLAPYGNAPAKAAVGKDLHQHCAYLMRLSATGISHEELQQFVQDAIGRLRDDLSSRNIIRIRKGKSPHDFRYLLSLDDPNAHLIERQGLVLTEAPGVAGRIYAETGALFAGWTSPRRATRYVDDTGQVRSIYKGGKNLTSQLEASGVKVIKEGRKRRYVFVLASEGSLEYAAWRRVLPITVRPPTQEDLWVQPRLLLKDLWPSLMDFIGEKIWI